MVSVLDFAFYHQKLRQDTINMDNKLSKECSSKLSTPTGNILYEIDQKYWHCIYLPLFPNPSPPPPAISAHCVNFILTISFRHFPFYFVTCRFFYISFLFHFVITNCSYISRGHWHHRRFYPGLPFEVDRERQSPPQPPLLPLSSSLLPTPPPLIIRINDQNIPKKHSRK